MKNYIIFTSCIFVLVFKAQEINLEGAKYLASLPLKCIEQEYPNKLGNILTSADDLGTPMQLHPAFYGCFDWHSSVHGHWSLVRISNLYPSLKDTIVPLLQSHISLKNIVEEYKYFNKKQEYSYERTYGWSWLMKLQLTLERSTDSQLTELAKNLSVLTEEIIKRYEIFLPKLQYPLRIGTHNNTAFGLSFAWDYADYKGNDSLKAVIRETAMRLFYNDQNCPLSWEPSGTDFLSPCLEELDLMERILPKEAFLPWAQKFLPQLFDPNFNLEPGKVGDRSDGHLVHLDGLNFSRAWVFYRLANAYPKELGHLKKLGDVHFDYSLPYVVDGNYEGEHWLASFALYALECREMN